MFCLLDTIILIIKVLDIYQTNYNTDLSNSIKILRPSYIFSQTLPIFKILPLIGYLIISYIISISYLFSGSKKK